MSLYINSFRQNLNANYFCKKDSKEKQNKLVFKSNTVKAERISSFKNQTIAGVGALALGTILAFVLRKNNKEKEQLVSSNDKHKDFIKQTYDLQKSSRSGFFYRGVPLP